MGMPLSLRLCSARLVRYAVWHEHVSVLSGYC